MVGNILKLLVLKIDCIETVCTHCFIAFFLKDLIAHQDYSKINKDLVENNKIYDDIMEIINYPLFYLNRNGDLICTNSFAKNFLDQYSLHTFNELATKIYLVSMDMTLSDYIQILKNDSSVSLEDIQISHQFLINSGYSKNGKRRTQNN